MRTIPKTYAELVNEGIEQAELKRMRRGLLTLPGTKVKATTKWNLDELFLLVHPYAKEVYVSDEKNPEYESRRDSLVTGCDVPILLAIQDIRLPIYTAWLKGLNPRCPRVICLTDYPIKPSSADLVYIIKDIFNPSSIRLGGAELHEGLERSLWGCVNHTYKLLKDSFPTTVDERYCWKPSEGHWTMSYGVRK